MKYLNLASGASHLVTPEIISQATIQALKLGNTFYGPDEGVDTLRKTISRRYAEDYNAQVQPENILINSGTKHALYTLFSVLLKPGDEVILPRPSWFGFQALLERTGAVIRFLETEAEDNYRLDPDTLEALITPKTRIVLFSNPNNPTGRIYTLPELQEFIKIIRKFPALYFLSDEIYDLVVYDGLKMPSLCQIPEILSQGIVVNGFSKNFAMSGWRIGYLVAPPELIRKCLEFQHATISGVNPFVQEGAASALANRTEIIPNIIQSFTKNRNHICGFLNRLNVIKYAKPEGAYYIFADFRPLLQKDFFAKNSIDSTLKLNAFLKENLQLEFVPGERFEMPGFMRITFAVSEEDLTEALGRLENLIKSI